MDIFKATVTLPENMKWAKSAWGAETVQLSDEESRKACVRSIGVWRMDKAESCERDDSAAQDRDLRKGGKFRSAYSSSRMEGHRHVGVGEGPGATNTPGDCQKEHKGKHVCLCD